jgi:hypothetical protein
MDGIGNGEGVEVRGYIYSVYLSILYIIWCTVYKVGLPV